MLQAPSLAKLARIRHAFFTRTGGVSQGVYASLNGGVGSNDAPDKVAENRARMAAALGRYAGSPAHALSNSFARGGGRRCAMDARQPPARRRRRHPNAVAGHRRFHRRLRAAAVCRRPSARDRRRPCRLARRVHRRDRSDRRGDGEARRRPQPHRGRARPHHQPAELRGRAGIRRTLSSRRMPPMRASSRPRIAPVTPCSISTAISPPVFNAPAL